MMNKKVLIMLGVSFVLASIGCESSSGNKGIVLEDKVAVESTHETKYTERVEIYKGTDDTPVKVTFTKSEANDFITFENAGARIQVFATNEEDNGRIYKNNDLKVRVKGDSIILRQGMQVIEMVRE